MKLSKKTPLALAVAAVLTAPTAMAAFSWDVDINDTVNRNYNSDVNRSVDTSYTNDTTVTNDLSNTVSNDVSRNVDTSYTSDVNRNVDTSYTSDVNRSVDTSFDASTNIENNITNDVDRDIIRKDVDVDVAVDVNKNINKNVVVDKDVDVDVDKTVDVDVNVDKDVTSTRLSVDKEADVSMTKRVNVDQDVTISGGAEVVGIIPIAGSSAAIVDGTQINHENHGYNFRHDNNAAMADSVMENASGNIGVNISAGDNNMQDNAAALSATMDRFVFGDASDAEAFTDQQVYGNELLNHDSNNTASVGENVLSNASGNIAVNVTAGSSNVQKNNLAVSVANSRYSVATVSTQQQSSLNSTENSSLDESIEVIDNGYTNSSLTSSGDSSFTTDSTSYSDATLSTATSTSNASGSMNRSGSRFAASMEGSRSASMDSSRSATMDASRSASMSGSRSVSADANGSVSYGGYDIDASGSGPAGGIIVLPPTSVGPVGIAAVGVVGGSVNASGYIGAHEFDSDFEANSSGSASMSGSSNASMSGTRSASMNSSGSASMSGSRSAGDYSLHRDGSRSTYDTEAHTTGAVGYSVATAATLNGTSAYSWDNYSLYQVNHLSPRSTNDASLGGGALQDASGNIGMNITVGSNNMQTNSLAIAAAHQGR